MLTKHVIAWRDHLLLHRDVRTSSARSELARRALTGDLVRVTHGAYLPTSLWRRLDGDEKFRMRIRAIQSVSSEQLVLSHASAAAIWGLPWFGPWPERLDALESAPTAATRLDAYVGTSHPATTTSSRSTACWSPI
jgi:hypothetical protein